MEEKGRLRVRVLADMEPLKIVPEVPVARVVTTLVLTAIVEVPERVMPVPDVSKFLISSKDGAELAPLERKT